MAFLVWVIFVKPARRFRRHRVCDRWRTDYQGGALSVVFVPLACVPFGFHSLIGSVRPKDDQHGRISGRCRILGHARPRARSASCDNRGHVALSGATILPINVPPAPSRRSAFRSVNLQTVRARWGEHRQVAQEARLCWPWAWLKIFRVCRVRGLMIYCYHLRESFSKSLFILTRSTPDARRSVSWSAVPGARLKPSNVTMMPGVISTALSCSDGVVIWTGSTNTLWPLFGGEPAARGRGARGRDDDPH